MLLLNINFDLLVVLQLFIVLFLVLGLFNQKFLVVQFKLDQLLLNFHENSRIDNSLGAGGVNLVLLYPDFGA